MIEPIFETAVLHFEEAALVGERHLGQHAASHLQKLANAWQDVCVGDGIRVLASLTGNSPRLQVPGKASRGIALKARSVLGGVDRRTPGSLELGHEFQPPRPAH
jgi:hypothetical protein